MRNRPDSGFTLIELLVVVLIIGILTAFAVPQYIRTIERSKADDALAILKMVGTVNRMYAMDNNNSYAVGTLTSSCNAMTACPLTQTSDVCNLLSCKYLAQQDWENRPYMVAAGNGNISAATCGGVSFGASRNYVACVKRKDYPTYVRGIGTDASPYSTWGFGLDINGKVETAGTDAPDPLGL